MFENRVQYCLILSRRGRSAVGQVGYGDDIPQGYKGQFLPSFKKLSTKLIQCTYLFPPMTCSLSLTAVLLLHQSHLARLFCKWGDTTQQWSSWRSLQVVETGKRWVVLVLSHDYGRILLTTPCKSPSSLFSSQQRHNWSTLQTVWICGKQGLLAVWKISLKKKVNVPVSNNLSW